MKYQSFDNSHEFELDKCPFCGADPTVTYIGNNNTTTRAIKIKCPICRIERTDGAIRYDFEWLENIASMSWNRRTNRLEVV